MLLLNQSTIPFRSQPDIDPKPVPSSLDERIVFKGRLGLNESHEIQSRLKKALQPNPTVLTVDLQWVESMDTAVLALLIISLGELKTRTSGLGIIQLYRPNPSVLALISIYCLENVFTIRR